MTTIDELSARYWDSYLAANPVYASLIGEHDYDGYVDDLSDSAIADRIRTLRALRAQARKVEAGGDSITRGLLLAMVDADLTEYETEILVAPVDPYLGVHSSMVRRAAQTKALEPSHALALRQRYDQVPRLLEQALARHRRLVAEDRAPVVTSVRRVLDQIDAYLSSDLRSDPFVGLNLPEGWQGEDGWRAAMEDVVRDAIRPAYAHYREVLEEEIAPAARVVAQAGICHVAEGEGIYRRLVERFLTMPFAPEEIHRIGLTHATETLVSEYETVGREAFGVSEPADIFSKLRTDPDLRFRSEEEMLSHAGEVVARAWAAIDGWLGARPDGPCQVLPVPATLAKDMPPAYYLQPSPDGSRPGTYFLNTYTPDTRDRFSAENTAFHEAIPGHHFDRALASRLTGIPAFRRLRSHNVHAEGWGLYSERLADEMGLYSGATDRLGMLSADSWRAGRLVVDTGLHHLGWTRDQAVNFLLEWTGLNRPVIEQEVDRYIGWPGQALSYKMGQIEIFRLRRHAESELGGDFDIVGFHDTLLTSGSVTIPVLRDLVNGWIENVKSGEGGI